ncbi:hypothetical protein JT359_15950 [Candidatus Poribacteria bacterium]|nr:hypothetical protein [Candidatus Poribacteria bacterium]
MLLRQIAFKVHKWDYSDGTTVQGINGMNVILTFPGWEQVLIDRGWNYIRQKKCKNLALESPSTDKLNA